MKHQCLFELKWNFPPGGQVSELKRAGKSDIAIGLMYGI